MAHPIGIVTQARIGSTRLPRKVLLEVGGKPLLAHHLSRLKQSGLPVFVATTQEPESALIRDLAQSMGVPSFAGDLNDVLARFRGCADAFGLEAIVRVTSDCPLVDGALIGREARRFLEIGDPDLYLSNVMERTFPRGFDFEIFSRAALEEAALRATEPSDREHVTPYLWKNRSQRMRFVHVRRATDASRFRITVDTPEDLEMVRMMIERYRAQDLDAEGIVKLLEAHPEVAAINAVIEQKKV